MPNADANIKGIEYEIRGTSGDAVKSLDKLANTLNKLKSATKGGLGIRSVSKNMQKLSDAISKMNPETLTGLSLALSRLGKLEIPSKAVDSVKSMAAALNQFDAGKMTALGSAFADFSKIKGLGKEEVGNGIRTIVDEIERLSQIDMTGVKEAGNALQQIGKAVKDASTVETGASGKKNTEKEYRNLFQIMHDGWTKSIGVVKKFGRTVKESLPAKAIGSSARGMARMLKYPFEGGIKSVKDYTKRLSGVLGGFKRIVGYRMIRQIIKEISQAFQEGVKNLYGWSQLTGGEFARSMDSIATSLLYLKNSLGALVAPIVNALAPAIDFLADKIVGLLNLVNQLFAKLAGASYWTRAKKKATEYEDAVSGVGGAAKEALRYLAPFDELNVLPDNKDRGGGGGGSQSDYSDMFEDVTEFNEEISDFAASIRESITKGDWEGLGTTLGSKVNELVDRIDFEGLGKRVGTGINAWFTTKYWTLNEINFQNIGSKIGEFLNGAMTNINFETIGRTFTQKFTVLGDLIIGAVEGTDWGLVGTSIGNYIKGVFNEASEWLQGIDWSTFGTTLYEDVKAAIDGLDFAGIATSFFSFLGSALGAGTAVLSSIMQGIVTDIKTYFLGFIKDENGDGHFGAGEIISGIFEGLKNALINIGKWVKDNIFTPFLNGFKSAFGIASPAKEMEEPGEMVGQGILEGLLKPFKDIKKWVEEHIINPIKNALKDFSITDILLGKDSSSGGTTINENGFSGGSDKIPIDVEITSVTDNIPAEKKVSKDWGIHVSDWEDKITPSKKSSTSYTAQVTNVDQSKLTAEQKTVPTTAKLNSVTNGLTGNSKPTVPVTANLNSSKNSLTGKSLPTVAVKASFESSTNKLTGKNLPKIDARANLTTYQRHFKTDTVGNKGKQPIIESRSNLTTYQRNFKSDTANGNGKTPLIGSVASLYEWWNNLTNNPLLDTVAKIISISDKREWYDRQLEFEAKVSSVNGIDAVTYGANGGVWTNSGKQPITRFAGGGLPRGSQLFWARERGPELVGTLGGHTAVMNNDQIVASVSAGVARAIAGIHFKMVGVGSAPMGDGDGGMSEDIIYRAMLRALNDSDAFPDEIDLDGDVVYRKMVARNQMNTRMTGRNAMAATA